MDPATLALLGGGASIGSLFFGSSAQDKVDEARRQTMAAERLRQQGYDAEAEKINTGAQDRYQNFGDQQTARATQLSDFFNTPVATPTTPNTVAAVPATTNDVVQREIDKKSGIASDYVDHQGKTLGTLRSFGDLMGDINRQQGHDATLVGQVGGFKKGSSGVAALELDAANHAGDDQRFIADLLSGAGKIGLSAGLSGTFAPAKVAGAPMNILPAAAQTAPTSIFSTGATPFLSYGR